MNEMAALDDPGRTGGEEAAERLTRLEERVDRLETAAVTVRDTADLEERIVQRVLERTGDSDAGREPLKSSDQVQAAAPHPTPAAERPIEAPPAPRIEAASKPAGSSRWLILEVLGEIRTIVAMLLDRSYHMRWMTWLYAIIFLGLIFTSHLWNPLSWIPWAGPVLAKLTDLILAMFLFKALSREAHRYRQQAR